MYASHRESGDHAVVNVLIGEYMYSLAIFLVTPDARSTKYTLNELSTNESFRLSGAQTARS